jgi:sugar/nucleoside kinase (ribokinase family)
MHALGLRAHHLDVLGADPFGDLVRALHASSGVPCTFVPAASGTKRAVNLVGPDGRRLSLYDARFSSADVFPADVLARLAPVSRHAHVSITHPCAAALPTLRATGPTISTDLHDWDGVDPYHLAFALAADVVFLSAAALPDHAAVMESIMDRGRASVVVATAGAAGSYLLPRHGSLQHVPAVAPPAPVVDSNGAGDAYVSGFLFGWLAGLPLPRCGLLGAIAGAHACASSAPISRAELLSRAA